MSVKESIIIASVSSFFAVFLLMTCGIRRPENPVTKGLDVLRGMYRRSKGNSFYQQKMEWLEKKGAPFHFGKRITPYSFFGARLGMGVLGFLVGNTLSPEAGLLFFCGLWELPVILVVVMNRQDNRKMLPEIKLLYRSLEIQLRAGVYLTDALSEGYGCVRERRLQKALLDLAGQIVMEGNIYEALDTFRKQFDNEQINVLCVILLQALETGQAVELIREMEGQMKDLEALLRYEKKQNLDRSITFYQLGILAAMLAVVLYACVTGMMGAAWFA